MTWASWSAPVCSPRDFQRVWVWAGHRNSESSSVGPIAWRQTAAPEWSYAPCPTPVSSAYPVPAHSTRIVSLGPPISIPEAYWAQLLWCPMSETAARVQICLTSWASFESRARPSNDQGKCAAGRKSSSEWIACSYPGPHHTLSRSASSRSPFAPLVRKRVETWTLLGLLCQWLSP